MASKNIVTVIHGVGKHEAGWAAEPHGPIATLEEAAKRPAYQQVFPEGNEIDKSIEFEEVQYDDIFEAVRQQWDTLLDELMDAGFDGASQSSVEAVKSFLPGELNTLGNALDEDKFFATHALDAILYKKFRLIRQIVRYSVAAQLAKIAAEHIQQDRDDDPTHTIVAHSLGTAVAYDAIDLLARTQWLNGVNKVTNASLAEATDSDTLERLKSRYGANPFSSNGIWEWHGLVMIANVSRIFCTAPSPTSINSRVRPKHSGGQNGRSVETYINVDHVFDPIAKVKPFNAGQTWPISSQEAFAMDVIGLKHFHDKNIHGFSHYLVHPSVHSRIFWLACPKRFGWSNVTQADARVGQDDFPNFGRQFTDDAQDAQRQLLEKGLAKIFSMKKSSESATKNHDTAVNSLGRLLKTVTA